MIRSLAVLEGVAIGLNPNYKVLSSSYPWIARKVLTDSSPQLRSTLQTLLYKDGIFRIDLLESLFTESLRAKNDQSLARSQVENVNSSAAMKQAVSFALTAKGAFLRGILLQELAKGLDALGLATLDYVTSSTSSIVPFGVQLSPVSMSNEDLVNLRTLHHLVLLLSRLQKHQSTNDVSIYPDVENKPKMGIEEVSLVPYQIISVQGFLPIISIILELPLESQLELVRLPVDLAGMLLSRMASRTITRIFQ